MNCGTKITSNSKFLFVLIAATLLAFGNIYGIPPGVVASVDSVEGTVTEIDDSGILVHFVRLKVHGKQDLDAVHKALRQRTNFGFRKKKRPRRGEALLMFPTWGNGEQKIPKMNVGDRIRVSKYQVVGSESARGGSVSFEKITVIKRGEQDAAMKRKGE